MLLDRVSPKTTVMSQNDAFVGTTGLSHARLFVEQNPPRLVSFLFPYSVLVSMSAHQEISVPIYKMFSSYVYVF